MAPEMPWGVLIPASATAANADVLSSGDQESALITNESFQR